MNTQKSHSPISLKVLSLQPFQVIGAVLLLILQAWTILYADDCYLSRSETSAIAISSLTIGALGYQAIHFDSAHASLIKGPMSWEVSVQKFLGGEYYPGKSNWLDTDFGSAFIPVFMGSVLLTADLSWPRNENEKGKELAQDIFLFGSGLMATAGITGISKGFFARPRPYLTMEPELAIQRAQQDYEKDHVSFFSSHTSIAFFSSAFVNKRLRSIMRREMSQDEYRSWRWAPPLICFGWASYVGWSRISSYKHYISDVVVGAAAGWLMAELFYSFGNDSKDSSKSDAENKMLFNISFNF
jgi:membrane-associated phospholipid phosphatase